MQTTQDRKKQILIVEDEGLIAADIQRRLERMGYSAPAIASSGEEALEYVRSTAFDLVLMDIRLKGGMDGIATAQALYERWQTPVVYLTAHADPDTVRRAALTEPLGYVLKPITDGTLGSTVQVALYKNEMERRLRTSEAWLSTTLHSVGDGIVATDPNGEIVFANAVAENLTGWSAAEAHGRELMDVFQLREESSGSLAKNPVLDLVPGEYRDYALVSKTGAETPVEVACFENCSLEESLGAILVVRDIRARRALEARLVQSQRMEAIANMAGGVAHDFNNLLTIILSHAEDLLVWLPFNERFQAREIKEAAVLASSISSQLLTLSRRDAERAEELEVDDAICEIQPMISHCLGPMVTLTTELDSTGRLVRADRNRLKQIFLNFALNARDAMPAGGEMRIESSGFDIEAGSPEARLCRPGSYVRLRVEDSGAGMEAATLARIFEPFFTTKTPEAGSGLGLSMVHSIVVQSGGCISAESKPGKGTSFEILLPCAGARGATGNIPEQSRARIPLATILLVDDEDSIRGLMRSYFEREGYQVLEARNAEEAESIADAHPDSVDVLVTDMVMPGKSGMQLAERLRHKRPEMKTLFVSGYQPDRFDVDWALGDSGDLLAKPFLGPELLRRVRALLSKEAAVTL
jgi:PAS domain S-box-containing protein